MYTLQLALVGAEALVLALLVLGVFRSRALTGRSPLYVLLGGFQYLVASSTLRVEIAPGWLVEPAPVLVFSATLMAVLLVYVTEEPRHTRRLVHALVLGNVGLTVLALLFAQHERIPGGEVPMAFVSGLLWRDAVLALMRAAALYGFLLGLLVVYEFVSRYVTLVAVRASLALAAMAAAETLAVTVLEHWGRAGVERAMLAAVTAGGVASAVFALLLWIYLQWVEPPLNMRSGTGDVSDVLQELTYRQLYEQARSRMTRDALTAVHNRGYFDEAFPRAVAHALRYKEHLSVLIADADNFKTINDRYSHLTGDKVLRLVASTLADGARTSDTVCRYGGDEFVVLLPNSSLASAQAFAERFQRRLRERAQAADLGLASLDVTATVGIASLLEDMADASPEDLLRLADNRLYVGKRAGRDRVVWRDLPVSSVS